jgi:hypothetical protein
VARTSGMLRDLGNEITKTTEAVPNTTVANAPAQGSQNAQQQEPVPVVIRQPPSTRDVRSRISIIRSWAFNILYSARSDRCPEADQANRMSSSKCEYVGHGKVGSARQPIMFR